MARVTCTFTFSIPGAGVTLLPDLPRWVEANGIADEAGSWRRELGAGFAVGSDRAKLIALAGEIDVVAARILAAEYPQHVVLAESPFDIGRQHSRAILHTLDGDPPDLEGATLLPADADLTHVPFAAELAGHRVWTVYVDELPVAFAYAAWRTPTYFDVSVDTLPGARQLGLGTIVAAALIADERPRAPVWGADEDNAASLRLAARLGFAPVDELWVLPP